MYTADWNVYTADLVYTADWSVHSGLECTQRTGIERKPKCFDVFQNLKWNVTVYSKNFGTKPKLFDVFQFLFSKSKTFLFFQKILDQNQNCLMCSNFFLAKAKHYYIIQKILDLKENVLVR